MAYKNQAVQNAANNIKTNYDIVRQNAQNAYKNVDDYYSFAEENLNKGYQAYQQALKAKLDSDLAQNKFRQEQLNDEFKQTARDIYKQGQAFENRSGTANESFVSSGLSGSGYADTVRAQNYADTQRKLSEAETALADKIAELQNQKNTLIYQNDIETAAQLQAKISQLTSLKESVLSYITSIAQTAYSQDLNERQFAYQKQRDRIEDQQKEEENIKNNDDDEIVLK